MKLVKSLSIIALSAVFSCGAFAADDAMQAAPATPDAGTVSSVPAAPSSTQTTTTTKTTETTATTTTPADSETYSKENCAKMMENCATNKEVESVCETQAKKCQDQLVKENEKKLNDLHSGTDATQK